MKKKLMYILLGILVILGGTLFDVMFIRAYTFIEYIFICSWEFAILSMGIYIGYKIYD